MKNKWIKWLVGLISVVSFASLIGLFHQSGYKTEEGMEPSAVSPQEFTTETMIESENNPVELDWDETWFGTPSQQTTETLDLQDNPIAFDESLLSIDLHTESKIEILDQKQVVNQQNVPSKKTQTKSS